MVNAIVPLSGGHDQYLLTSGTHAGNGRLRREGIQPVSNCHQEEFNDDCTAADASLATSTLNMIRKTSRGRLASHKPTLNQCNDVLGKQHAVCWPNSRPSKVEARPANGSHPEHAVQMLLQCWKASWTWTRSWKFSVSKQQDTTICIVHRSEEANHEANHEAHRIPQECWRVDPASDVSSRITHTAPPARKQSDLIPPARTRLIGTMCRRWTPGNPSWVSDRLELFSRPVPSRLVRRRRILPDLKSTQGVTPRKVHRSCSRTQIAELFP